MTASVKKLTDDFNKEAAKVVGLEQMIQHLKFEATLVKDRKTRNAEFADAVAVASAYSEGEHGRRGCRCLS